MGSHLEVWDLFYLGQLTTELGLCFLGCYEPFCKLGKDTPPSGRNTVPCQGVLLGRPSLVVTFIPYLPPLDGIPAPQLVGALGVDMIVGAHVSVLLRVRDRQGLRL